jgi:phytoene dehydrogenase-like protein
MSSEKYGLIVIGGGITGLSTALGYALNEDLSQHPVLLLEKEPKVGGYVTSFKRKGFLFDTVQMIPDVTRILKYFGVEIDLKQFSGYYARVFLADPATGSAKVIEIPSGIAEFEQMLIGRYPGQAQQVVKMLAHSRSMYGELERLKVEPSFLDLIGALFTCTKTVRHGLKTYTAYLDQFGLTDPELREIFDVFGAFSGLPSDRVAALLPVVAMNSLMEGTYRTVKGFIHLPHRMRKRLEALGGKIRTKSKVARILVDDGRVRGVELASGEVIEAERVVTTIDPKVAMGQLVGLDLIRGLDPAYADKVESVKMSFASFTVSLGLDEEIDLAGLGLDCGYNVITTGGGTFEKLFLAAERGEIGYTDDCFHTAVICPSLTTGSKPCLIIRALPLPIADWSELRVNDPDRYMARKDRWADFFVDKVERYVVPNLTDHIVVRDVASPATFARYSGSPTGSPYDMSPYPDNLGRNRLKMRTPVAGLFQPKFGHGILASMLGGLQAVDMMLEGKVMNGYSRMRT